MKKIAVFWLRSENQFVVSTSLFVVSASGSLKVKKVLFFAEIQVKFVRICQLFNSFFRSHILLVRNSTVLVQLLTRKLKILSEKKKVQKNSQWKSEKIFFVQYKISSEKGARNLEEKKNYCVTQF